MKKRLIVTLLLVAFTPLFANASWWNPLSWFNGWNIFHKEEPKTQILEDKINELEKRLEEKEKAAPALSEKQSPVTEVKSENKTGTKPASKTPSQSGQPVVNQSYQQMLTELEKRADVIRDTTDATELVSKFKEFGKQVQDTLTHNTNISNYTASSLSELIQKINSAVYELNNQSSSQKNLDYYTTQYKNLVLSYNNLGFHIKTDKEKIADMALNQAAADAQAKIEREENLRKVNMKLAELRGVFQQIELVNPNSGVGIVIAMVPTITDLNGNKLFTPQNTPEYNSYWPSQYIQDVLLVIQKEITKMTILQAQYNI